MLADELLDGVSFIAGVRLDRSLKRVAEQLVGELGGLADDVPRGSALWSCPPQAPPAPQCLTRLRELERWSRVGFERGMAMRRGER